MIKEIEISEAISLELPIIDVRSPGEFEQGHIPTATNIPLFENDERAKVGTTYKQQSQEEAIKLGLALVTPKLNWFIEKSKEVAPQKKVIVHCWRGGMRSKAFAEHLFNNGFNEVYVVIGGYKSFRRLVLAFYEKPLKLKVLGGYTGSGKTYILKNLREKGHQVIDLENLANHKGSAFGGIGELPQPTNEQYENNLYFEFLSIDISKPIWIEDESDKIGRVNVPFMLYRQIRNAELLFLSIPRKERAKFLMNDYAKLDKEELIAAVKRIEKRLGGLNVKNSIELINNDNFLEAANITLGYYDKSYQKGMSRRDPEKIINIKLSEVDIENNTLILENYE